MITDNKGNVKIIQIGFKWALVDAAEVLILAGSAFYALNNTIALPFWTYTTENEKWRVLADRRR